MIDFLNQFCYRSRIRIFIFKFVESLVSSHQHSHFFAHSITRRINWILHLEIGVVEESCALKVTKYEHDSVDNTKHFDAQVKCECFYWENNTRQWLTKQQRR